MDQGAVKVVAHEVLGGVFDVAGAIAESPFVFKLGDMGDSTADSLRGLLEILPIAARAKLSGGGELALLFGEADAGRFVAISAGDKTGKSAFDAGDIAQFEETAQAMLSAGLTRLVRATGEQMSIQSVLVEQMGAGGVDSLVDFMGPSTQISFRFQSAPRFDTMAALLVSHELEGRVPNDVVDSYSDEEDMGQPKLVSDQEMKDILSGFGSDSASPQTTADLQGNLDVILDIELLATVRLGSIEMPLAEVLRLGPGSIIEVGQLVDDPVELLVNGRLVARGDVVVVDEKFGLRITQIVSRKERIESLR